MRTIARLTVIWMMSIVAAGCWDNRELDEYGFVQAVAIDRQEDGRIDLTTHFYNPSSKSEGGEGAKSAQNSQSAQKGINIRTSGDTIFEAIRDIPMKFGRKAKWDHMRIILLGERLARAQNIGEVLDYFSRDHEPRGTVLPLIADGDAAQYLEIKPFIEQTIGQQYKKMETDGSRYSSKTSRIPLYELAIHLKNPSGTAAVAYIHRSGPGDDVVISKVAFFKQGKLARIIGEKDAEVYMILTDKYDSGILEFPCLGDGEGARAKESFEVLSIDSKIYPEVRGEEIKVRAKVRIKGTLGELRCSVLKSRQDARRLEKRIGREVERRIQEGLADLQREKLDALGIGTQIYRRNPKLWRRLEPDWDDRFARIRFQVRVEVRMLSTGLNVGTPFGTKEKK